MGLVRSATGLKEFEVLARLRPILRGTRGSAQLVWYLPNAPDGFFVAIHEVKILLLALPDRPVELKESFAGAMGIEARLDAVGVYVDTGLIAVVNVLR